MASMVLMTNPPKLVYDESGRLIEVILTAGDYLAYLRSLADEMDWESLPAHLQDAIDRMLIDDVRNEKETAVDLDAVLTDET
jgi:hypothetical protein